MCNNIQKISFVKPLACLWPGCEARRGCHHLSRPSEGNSVKQKTIFACQKCGSQSPKWLGKCPDCGSWNSMAEESVLKLGAAGPVAVSSRAVPICDVPAQSETRVVTGIGELDRVLGGGIVPGSLVLIGGDPGIGKSTLTLQLGEQVARQGAV